MIFNAHKMGLELGVRVGGLGGWKKEIKEAEDENKKQLKGKFCFHVEQKCVRSTPDRLWVKRMIGTRPRLNEMCDGFGKRPRNKRYVLLNTDTSVVIEHTQGGFKGLQGPGEGGQGCRKPCEGPICSN